MPITYTEIIRPLLLLPIVIAHAIVRLLRIITGDLFTFHITLNLFIFIFGVNLVIDSFIRVQRADVINFWFIRSFDSTHVIITVVKTHINEKFILTSKFWRLNSRKYSNLLGNPFWSGRALGSFKISNSSLKYLILFLSSMLKLWSVRNHLKFGFRF
jgi:hypothetical protein